MKKAEGQDHMTVLLPWQTIKRTRGHKVSQGKAFHLGLLQGSLAVDEGMQTPKDCLLANLKSLIWNPNEFSIDERICFQRTIYGTGAVDPTPNNGRANAAAAAAEATQPQSMLQTDETMLEYRKSWAFNDRRNCIWS